MHIAQLPKSSFYHHKGKPDPDAADKALVAEVFARHKGRYGQRRIAHELSFNHKKVGRLMKLMGLKAKVRPKKAHRNPAMGDTSENILNRQFEAQKPKQKLLTDVTEFHGKDGKLYLSPLLDLFNREIVTYTLSRSPNSAMVDRMLKQAFAHPQKDCLLHSDQGVLYRTHSFRKLLSEYSIAQSMSRKGNCWDNAPMESFFAVLKTECFYREGELTVAELIKMVDEYMYYYNNERCSLKLKKLSPVQYRTQFVQTA